VLDLLQAENLLLSILQPLLQYLIAADLIFPDFLLDSFEVLNRVDIDPSLSFVISWFLCMGVFLPLEADDRWIKNSRFPRKSLRFWAKLSSQESPCCAVRVRYLFNISFCPFARDYR
jgi:hypothetical protein